MNSTWTLSVSVLKFLLKSQWLMPFISLMVAKWWRALSSHPQWPLLCNLPASWDLCRGHQLKAFQDPQETGSSVVLLDA